MYGRSDGYTGNKSVNMVSGLVTRYKISNLLPYRNYTVFIRANTVLGHGEWSHPVTVQTPWRRYSEMIIFAKYFQKKPITVDWGFRASWLVQNQTIWVSPYRNKAMWLVDWGFRACWLVQNQAIWVSPYRNKAMLIGWLGIFARSDWFRIKPFEYHRTVTKQCDLLIGVFARPSHCTLTVL